MSSTTPAAGSDVTTPSTLPDPKQVSKLSYFFVYAPDYTDPEAFTRRMKVRARHLEDAKPLTTSGVWKVAGGLLTPESLEDGAEKHLIGSAFIVQAGNIDVVRKRLQEDIYWTSDVWDKEKMVIAPFLPATAL